ncbi:hypothetical protein L1887_53363 [Cichorium endivia]|nr:hypothetical protein L1887_53363 [Cichorium endivia]
MSRYARADEREEWPAKLGMGGWEARCESRCWIYPRVRARLRLDLTLRMVRGRGGVDCERSNEERLRALSAQAGGMSVHLDKSPSVGRRRVQAPRCGSQRRRCGRAVGCWEDSQRRRLPSGSCCALRKSALQLAEVGGGHAREICRGASGLHSSSSHAKGSGVERSGAASGSWAQIAQFQSLNSSQRAYVPSAASTALTVIDPVSSFSSASRLAQPTGLPHRHHCTGEDAAAATLGPPPAGSRAPTSALY